MQTKKVLIIRFSSFGDIIQCLGVPQAIKQNWPEATVHWAVRSDFRELLAFNPHIDHIQELNRKKGFSELIRLYFWIRKQKYTHIYDAHNNLRSNILCTLLWRHRQFHRIAFTRRPKHRLAKFLLFKFHVNLFLPKPFICVKTYLQPLEKWGVYPKSNNGRNFYVSPSDVEQARALIGNFKNFLVIAPSSAWPLKRWPIEYWKTLLKLVDTLPAVILGGPQDTFCEEIALALKDRQNPVLNLAGKTSLGLSCAIISLADLVIANDTGLLHAADQMSIPAIVMIGPVPFGYPGNHTSRVMEVDIWCKPCSKDGNTTCKNKAHPHQCLRDIHPEAVAREAKQILKRSERDQ
jgi:ADP-heptose:LPS heptosyltransferase